MSDLQEDGDFELTAEQIEELDRRVEEYRNDPSLAIPWEQVKKQAHERLQRLKPQLNDDRSDTA